MTDQNRDGTYRPEELERDLAELRSFAERYRAFMGTRIVGYADLVEKLLICFLCEGNVLLEGAPGLGKTTLARAWAECSGLEFRRIQFTPDLMPLDIIGSNILVADRGADAEPYRFIKGPVFANVVLGDEINRATPKTQSAFLEAMEEKQVSFLGSTMKLPRPFFVIATQNPIELEGTYPLPEAQTDRFLMRLFFDMPDFQTLKAILEAGAGSDSPGGNTEKPAAPGKEAALSAMGAFRRAAGAVLCPEEVKNFIVRLILQTHPDSTSVEKVRKSLRYGASPRCAKGLFAAARARAILQGRAHMSFDDVSELFIDTANHRVVCAFGAEAESAQAPLKAVLAEVRREYLGSA
ncbi:MAG: AAA family ATPase [Rectinemataceae bacterium]